MFVPNKGDLIWISFDPSAGNEIMKRRTALVISQKIFNDHTGFAIVAQITSNIRGLKLDVLLPASLQTKGSVLMYQMKAIDFNNRNAEFIEKAPNEVIKKATQIANVIIQ